MYFLIYVSDESPKAKFEMKKLHQLQADVMNILLLVPYFR